MFSRPNSSRVTVGLIIIGLINLVTNYRTFAVRRSNLTETRLYVTPAQNSMTNNIMHAVKTLYSLKLSNCQATGPS